MKYEISQEQFCTFLNALSYEAQALRTATSPNSAVGTLAIASAANPCRNEIRISTSGTANNVPAIYATTLPMVACNYISWGDLIAYLDWAALRPMTEFEFEKICRGTSVPIASENAWGTTNLLQAQSSALTNAGLANEISTASGSGLCAYGANNMARGPLRCGFGATAATTRVQSGSSFYGVMDMSGNANEQCIGGYNYNYSSFTTANGNGELNSIALADVPGWPSLGGGQNGGVVRGSNWHTATPQDLNISDRGQMSQNSNSIRDHRFGGRGVRNW
jgi:formylglycine-generating enzyme required for sulfatase activity